MARSTTPRRRTLASAALIAAVSPALLGVTPASAGTMSSVYVPSATANGVTWKNLSAGAVQTAQQQAEPTTRTAYHHPNATPAKKKALRAKCKQEGKVYVPPKRGSSHSPGTCKAKETRSLKEQIRNLFGTTWN